MLHPPSLKEIPRYPVTTFLAAAAIIVTGMWWSGRDIDGFVTNGRVWERAEVWRAFTSTLPHVNFFHLAFNLYWLWVFGAVIERAYGHLKTFGIYLLLAFGSALAEFTFLSGGVGLSGVGYGLWGMLWVLERRDPRFAGTVDAQTSRTFVSWFFLCIALTVTDVMPVANIAHGVGAGMGALLGLAATTRGKARWSSCAGLIAVVVLSLIGSTMLWPWINLSGQAEAEVAYAGFKALDRGDNERARKLLDLSTHLRGASATTWYNLGVACQRLEKYDEALAAFEHAAQMPDATSDMREPAQRLREYLARKHRNP